MPPHTTITNLGAVKAQSIAYDATKAAIAVPQVNTADTFTTLNAEQTLTNKTLTTPVIASLKPSSTGGTITMPTVASGSSATLATTTDISSATTNVITTNGEQTLTNKTLTTPIIASLKQSGTGGTINMPTVASGETATLATTDDIPSVSNMVTTDTAQTITANKTFTTGSLTFDNGMTINTNTNKDLFKITYEASGDVEFCREYPDPDDPTHESTTISTIHLPETRTGDQILVAELHPQTLENKTLITPVIASLKASSTGGTINMPTVASGESATLATTDDITSASGNFVTLDTTQTISGSKSFSLMPYLNSGVSASTTRNGVNKNFFVGADSGGAYIKFSRVEGTNHSTLLIPEHTASTDYVATTQLAQTLENKTLTSPVLTDGTHTISMPAAANLTANTTFATALDIASLESSLASATDFNTLKTILGNLITYLSNWADVGNLNMSDIVSEVDSTNYLGLTTP